MFAYLLLHVRPTDVSGTKLAAALSQDSQYSRECERREKPDEVPTQRPYGRYPHRQYHWHYTEQADSNKTTYDECGDAAAVEEPLVAMHGKDRVCDSGPSAGCKSDGEPRVPCSKGNGRERDRNQRSTGCPTAKPMVERKIGRLIGGAVSTAARGFLPFVVPVAHGESARETRRHAP